MNKKKTCHDLTLCWSCANAVPKCDKKGRYITGCSWSIRLQPVKGWDAEVCTYDGLSRSDSYHVKACPLYKKG